MKVKPLTCVPRGCDQSSWTERGALLREQWASLCRNWPVGFFQFAPGVGQEFMKIHRKECFRVQWWKGKNAEWSSFGIMKGTNSVWRILSFLRQKFLGQTWRSGLLSPPIYAMEYSLSSPQPVFERGPETPTSTEQVSKAILFHSGVFVIFPFSAQGFFQPTKYSKSIFSDS